MEYLAEVTVEMVIKVEAKDDKEANKKVSNYLESIKGAESWDIEFLGKKH